MVNFILNKSVIRAACRHSIGFVKTKNKNKQKKIKNNNNKTDIP